MTTFDLNKIKTKRSTSLSKEELKDVEKMLDQAVKDPFLFFNPERIKEERKKLRTIIFYEEEVVGYYSPAKTNIRGVDFWRAGAIYLLPKYRGKGIAEKVLKEFFEKHSPGFAWIDDRNHKSISLFKRLGFERGEEKNYDDGENGHYYYKDKKPPPKKEPSIYKW